MTPRENFLNFFRDKPYDHIPSTMDTCKFHPAMVPKFVARGAVIQQRAMDPSQWVELHDDWEHSARR